MRTGRSISSMSGFRKGSLIGKTGNGFRKDGEKSSPNEPENLKDRLERMDEERLDSSRRGGGSSGMWFF